MDPQVIHNYELERLVKLEAAIRAFLATQDLGMISIREKALAELRKALDE